MEATPPIQTASPMAFRLASAYGVQRSAAPTPASASATPPATAQVSNGIKGLIAAKVPQRMDFEVPLSARRNVSEAFNLYRHPADRNNAATGIELGRRVDVQG